MSFELVRNFVARGEAFRDNISIPVTITGSYPTFGPDPVQCTILPDMDKRHLGFGNLFDEHQQLQLRGKTRDAKEIWIPEFEVTSTSHAHSRHTAHDQISWEGTAQLFIEGDLDEFDASNGKIYCSVFLPPTPVALSGVGYVSKDDGTITIWEDQERKGIRWMTTLGEAELIEQYRYHHKEKVGLDPATVRILRCEIGMEIQGNGFTSLQSILCDLSPVLDETLWLVSFLGRRRVAWYGAEALFVPDKGSSDFHNATARRRQWMGHGYQNDDLTPQLNVLVNPERLKDGLFQQLLETYQSSLHHDTIRQVIILLLVSHERAYLENKLVNAYTALESLVYGLDGEGSITNLLRAGPFKKLSKRLKKVIREEIQDKKIAEGIIKKLGELQRRAFLDRLLMLIEKYDLDVTQLWPPDTDIPSELDALLKRRHLFIHQGKMDDNNAYLFDLNRLQNLLEMWILKLLDCPDTALNIHARGHLVPINKP